MTNRVEGASGRSPGRPRLYEPEDERNRILAATLEVLRRNSGEEATVADILQEAQLSTRAFYRHFETKEDAVRALYERDAEAFAARLRRHVDEAGDPPAALEAWIQEVLRLAFDRRRAERVSALDSPMARRIMAGTGVQARGNRLYVEPLLAVLERGRASGDFPAARPDLDVHTIRAITWETIDWIRTGAFRLTRKRHSTTFSASAWPRSAVRGKVVLSLRSRSLQPYIGGGNRASRGHGAHKRRRPHRGAAVDDRVLQGPRPGGL